MDSDRCQLYSFVFTDTCTCTCIKISPPLTRHPVAHEKMEPVAVITGANAYVYLKCMAHFPLICQTLYNTSGIGLSIAQRLLTEKSGVRVCLACRNLQKAKDARQLLLTEHPQAQIDIMHIDTSSVASSLNAAKEIARRYAGCRPVRNATP